MRKQAVIKPENQEIPLKASFRKLSAGSLISDENLFCKRENSTALLMLMIRRVRKWDLAQRNGNGMKPDKLGRICYMIYPNFENAVEISIVLWYTIYRVRDD